MARITYIPNRVIDINGISDGASLNVYQSGGTTPVPLFIDSGLSTPTTNPYVVAAGAAVPALYTSYAGQLRFRVVASDGSVPQDDDPYERPMTSAELIDDTGAGLVGYKLDDPDAVTRTVLERLRSEVFVEDFGALATTEEPAASVMTANVAAFNAAFAFAIAAAATLRCKGGDYYLNGTIAPGGRYDAMWGETQLIFDTAGSYTEILENPSGASQTGSGNFVAFDTSTCTRSSNSGVLTLSTNAVVPDMKAASRATIPSTLVAISAATASSGEMSFDQLDITKFGWAMWQGPFTGSAQIILPYTRWRIGRLSAQFCLNMFRSGTSGNGFDDISIALARFNRNTGIGYVNGTTMTVQSFFTIGLQRSLDAEDETIAFTASSTTAVLSAPNPNVVIGTIIATPEGGRLNKDGDAIGFVARVNAIDIDGVTLTLNVAPEATLSGLGLLINPPSFWANQGGFTINHFYFEHVYEDPIRLFNTASFRCPEFKISRAEMAYKHAPIYMSGDGCSIDIGLHDATENNAVTRLVVGVSSTRDGTDYISASVRVSSSIKRSEWVKSDPIGVVETWTTNLSGRTEASDDNNPKLRLIVDYADQEVVFAPYNAARDTYSTDSFRTFVEEIAVIDTASRTGGFAAVAGSASVKSPGSSGTLYHAVTPVEGGVYRVTFAATPFTTGIPFLRLRDSGGSTTIAGYAVMTRTGGLCTAFFVAPAGVGRVEISGDTAGDYTVTQFDLHRLVYA